jgi:hypothetical protein
MRVHCLFGISLRRHASSAMPRFDIRGSFSHLAIAFLAYSFSFLVLFSAHLYQCLCSFCARLVFIRFGCGTSVQPTNKSIPSNVHVRDHQNIICSVFDRPRVSFIFANLFGHHISPDIPRGCDPPTLHAMGPKRETARQVIKLVSAGGLNTVPGSGLCLYV